MYNQTGIPKGTANNITNVNTALKKLDHESITGKLDAAQVDSKAGIIIVGISGEVESSAGQKYHFHGARVLTSGPDHPNFVNPHFHKNGEEPYSILSGTDGEMNLGRVNDGEDGQKVVWDEPRIVKAGDFIEVQEEQVHSLRNNGKEPLDFVFACPDEHLVDFSEERPDGDRYFTRDLPDGIPPWYLK